MEVSIGGILAQIINFGILFFLYKKFLAKPMVAAIESRRSLIKKLESADTAYDEKMLEAKTASDELIQEGLGKKEKLIAEAGILASKRRDEILSEARDKADSIISEAQSKGKNLASELENNFAAGVKKTSLLVIKKLFAKDTNLQTAYLDEIVNDVTK